MTVTDTLSLTHSHSHSHTHSDTDTRVWPDRHRVSVTHTPSYTVTVRLKQCHVVPGGPVSIIWCITFDDAMASIATVLQITIISRQESRNASTSSRPFSRIRPWTSWEVKLPVAIETSGIYNNRDVSPHNVDLIVNSARLPGIQTFLMGNRSSGNAPEPSLPKLKIRVMGNSIKPHIERAEKTGTCNLAKQGLDEVK